MALVAIRAVVHVPVNPLVRLVSRGLGMANGAGEHGIVRWIGMAITARRRPAMVLREIRVVKRGPRPCGGGVASLASGREPGRGVVGVGCALIVRLMAPVAVGRKSCVIVVDMAARTGRRNMGAGQRKSGVVVVVVRRNPRRRVMADVTGIGKTNLCVVRAVGICKIRHVTRRANRIAGSERVVPFHVTLRTLQSGVGAGQRESGAGMVERPVTP